MSTHPAASVADGGPLAGLTVLDLTLALAGPFATFLLAGLGARVIKIEHPAAPDPCRQNPPYLGANGVTLGRTGPAGRLRVGVEPPARQVRSDARPETAAGARRVRRLAPCAPTSSSRTSAPGRSIGSASATTSAAPSTRARFTARSRASARRGRSGTGKAMDSIIQALSGLMMTSGAPGDPPVRVGVPVADLLAPVFAVVGILAALRQRERTGAGQHVDVSMLGVLTSLVAAEPFDLLEACGLAQRTGRMVPRLTPFGIYESADGHVAICAPTEQFARGVFDAIGEPDFGDDPRYATRDARVAHVDELNARIEAFTRTQPTAMLLPLLEQHGVPAAAVRAPAAAVRDPRVLARGETVPLEHPQFGRVADVIGMGVPITFSAARPTGRCGRRRIPARTTRWCTASGWATAPMASSACAPTGSSETGVDDVGRHRDADRRFRGSIHGRRRNGSHASGGRDLVAHCSESRSSAPRACGRSSCAATSTATPLADARLEAGVFPNRVRQLVEAVLRRTPAPHGVPRPAAHLGCGLQGLSLPARADPSRRRAAARADPALRSAAVRRARRARVQRGADARPLRDARVARAAAGLGRRRARRDRARQHGARVDATSAGPASRRAARLGCGGPASPRGILATRAGRLRARWPARPPTCSAGGRHSTGRA